MESRLEIIKSIRKTITFVFFSLPLLAAGVIPAGCGKPKAPVEEHGTPGIIDLSGFIHSGDAVDENHFTKGLRMTGMSSELWSLKEKMELPVDRSFDLALLVVQGKGSFQFGLMNPRSFKTEDLLFLPAHLPVTLNPGAAGVRFLVFRTPDREAE